MTDGVGWRIGGYIPPQQEPVAIAIGGRTVQQTASGAWEETKVTHGIFEIQNMPDMAGFWFLLALMVKKGSIKDVKDILMKLFDGIFDSVQRYSTGAVGNPITAWGAGRLNSLLLERFGLITQIQAQDFASGISVIAGAEEVISGLAASPISLKLGGSPPANFPGQVTIADTTYKVERETRLIPKAVDKSISMEKKS